MFVKNERDDDDAEEILDEVHTTGATRLSFQMYIQRSFPTTEHGASLIESFSTFTLQFISELSNIHRHVRTHPARPRSHHQ